MNLIEKALERIEQCDTTEDLRDEFTTIRKHIARMQSELLHQVGDTRRCPMCDGLFVPGDSTQEAGVKALKGMQDE